MDDRTLMEAVNEIGRRAYDTAVKRGQYDTRPKDDRERRTRYATRVTDECIEAEFAPTRWEWLEELADVLIAACSVAHAESCDLGSMVLLKMQKNIDRIEEEETDGDDRTPDRQI